MTFLASMLRDEGGFEYKKAIVDTVIHIIEDNPEAKDVGEVLVLVLLIQASASSQLKLYVIARERPWLYEGVFQYVEL